MDKITVYVYEVIEGEYKGKTVKSFDSNLVDFQTAMKVNPNMPIACFDDENEYVLFAKELKRVEKYEMDIPEEFKSLFNDSANPMFFR